MCTLAFGNILTRTKTSDGKSVYEEGGAFVQVTPKAIILLDIVTATSGDSWILDEGQTIVAADLSASQIAVALNLGRVVLFTILNGRLKRQK